MIYKSCITLRTLNDGNSGIFLILGHAGFISSAVVTRVVIEVTMLRITSNPN